MISLYVLAIGLWIFAAGCAIGDRVTSASMTNAKVSAFFFSAVAVLVDVALKFWV